MLADLADPAKLRKVEDEIATFTFELRKVLTGVPNLKGFDFNARPFTNRLQLLLATYSLLVAVTALEWASSVSVVSANPSRIQPSPRSFSSPTKLTPYLEMVLGHLDLRCSQLQFIPPHVGDREDTGIPPLWVDPGGDELIPNLIRKIQFQFIGPGRQSRALELARRSTSAPKTGTYCDKEPSLHFLRSKTRTGHSFVPQYFRTAYLTV
jgi:hypothetical protein